MRVARRARLCAGAGIVSERALLQTSSANFQSKFPSGTVEPARFFLSSLSVLFYFSYIVGNFSVWLVPFSPGFFRFR